MDSKEDLICCHFNVPPLEEFEEEYDDTSKSDDMVKEPIVETVEEECPMKCVFDNAEELFPYKVAHFEANNINCVTDAPPDSIESVFDTPPAWSTTKVELHNHNNNPKTPGGVTETLCLDFLHGEDQNWFF